MYALVLTFDKYRPFAAHMIQCYEKLWPDNPFIFRVPYQGEGVKIYYEEKFGKKVEMIKSPSGIVDTMCALSEGLKEEEWVYWCMDDRYPVKLDTCTINKCLSLLNSKNIISGIMFCNNPQIWYKEHNYGKEYVIKDCGLTLYRRRDYTMIWNHQFLRVDVIKTFFNLFPRDMKQAKEMDYIKDRAILPDRQHLYVLDFNAGVYGESTTRGVITLNCYESLIKHCFDIPEGFSVSKKRIYKGKNSKLYNKLYPFYVKLKKYLHA